MNRKQIIILISSIAGAVILATGITLLCTAGHTKVNYTETIIEEKPILDRSIENVVSILNEKIRNIGELATDENDFVAESSYRSVKKLGKWEVGFTESEYTVNCNAVVKSGIDFDKVRTRLLDDSKTVVITLPEARILSIELDNESLTVVSEKESIFNKTGIEVFNNSEKELKESAQTQALDGGTLERAEKTAKNELSEFVYGFLDPYDYEIRFETSKEFLQASGIQ